MTSNAENIRAPRWYQRALPVSALLVAVVAVLALVFPAFRDQVALSATHQTQQYVALSFGRAADGTVLVCNRTHSTVKVKFAVDSHLRQSRELKYVVTVGSTTRAGTVTADAGRITTVS